jgi:hypothetical protein
MPVPQENVAVRKAPSLPNLLNMKVSESQASLPRFDFVKADQERRASKGENTRVLPQSLSIQSIDHSNLSVIDMYRDVSSFVSQDSDEDKQPSKDPLPIQSVSAHDLLTLKSSRNNVSKIRLSIEENRTKISSDRDRYGFKKATNFISESRYNSWWVDYSRHCARRKKKWEALMSKSGLSLYNDNPVRFPPRSEKLKRYIRKGIPAEWRGNAWWYFAKGPEKLKNNIGVYDALIESTIHLKNKDTEIIERDLNRTFPDNIYFKPENITEYSDAPLIEALRRVLVAFSVYNPAIGYCQSLNFIAGLLLIFLDEEKAFWMLVIITSRFLPGVHEVSLEGVNVDQGVLMLAIKEFLPNTWDVITSINFENETTHPQASKGKVNHDFLVKLPPITLCTSSWFMSAFIGILPIETTLRVWDCLFYEESSFLFKVALSVFKIVEPQIMSIHDEMEIFQIIQNTPKLLIDPNILFDTLFKRRLGLNNLTQEEVVRCKKYVIERRQRSKMDNSNDLNDTDFNRKLLAESLWQPDLYGFRKGLPGMHWNKNLTRKMRSKIARR